MRRPVRAPARPRSHPGLVFAFALALAGCTEEPITRPPESPAPPVAASRPPEPAAAPALPYPRTRTVEVKDNIFGTDVLDPYRWLEDEKSDEVKGWMKAQDALTRAQLANLPERDAIAGRLKELYYLDSISAPRHRGTRYFYSRRHATKEKSIVYWKEGKKGEEKVLLDPNAWSTDGSVSLGGYTPSWDGKKVAYKVKKNNSDESTLYVMDVATGKKSDVDTIEGAKYATASWTPRSDGFYYTWLPVDPSIKVADRPGHAEVRFHKLGQDAKKDTLIREKTGDPTRFIQGWISDDGHWLFLAVFDGWSSNEVYFRDLRTGSKEWKPLAVGVKAHFNVDAFKDQFFVHTDDGASRYRVFRVDPKRPERASWKEIISERADATMDEANVIGGSLVVRYLKNASSLLEVHDLDGKLVREVKLPGIGSVGGPIGRSDEDEAYYSFESFTTPSEIYGTSVKTGKTELYAKTKVPVDPSPFAVEQVFFPSKDGTRVSMFIVRRRGAKNDGSAPTLLYGYGGFQASETPSFVSTIYPWLERGGTYALANLRGGGEYGEAWHKDGMLLKKQNVFDDFIAAAEFLIKEGYTKPDKLVSWGSSNGGLLTGATLVQRPDLWRGVLCGVPLLDMVRYHLFGSGKTWISEYGSAEKAEQFKVLHGYSPYHHVKTGTKYPAVLLLSADSDDRVDPMHARKFAAALQAASAGGPVLLRIEKNSGHGGADMIKAAVEKGADQLAFALAVTKGAQAAPNPGPARRP
jgi:prolyl oligopeptidase